MQGLVRSLMHMVRSVVRYVPETRTVPMNLSPLSHHTALREGFALPCQKVFL